MTLPATLTTLGYFWTLQRNDGVGLASTSHDQPITWGGQRFEATPGFRPTEVRLDDRLIATKIEMAGALSSDALTLQDLRAGRWQSATFLLSSADWSDESGKPQLLCRGTLGDVRATNSSFTAQLDAVPPRWRDQPCPQTSPECRAQLGDKQCRVSLRTRQRTVKVVQVEGAKITIAGEVGNDYIYGRARWLSGLSAGLGQTIVAVDGDVITLREPAPEPARAGDRMRLVEGCDGRLATCSERFNNVLNFRGEPHLPGTDVLMRYPGG